jgi:hypothetical protein
VVSQPARDTLIGLGILLGFLPFCALLAVSIAGIPLIPVAVLLVLSMFILGLTAIASAVGQKLGADAGPERMLASVAIGMLMLAVGSAIPFLGGFVLFVASIYGAGAVVSTRFGTRSPGPRPNAPETSARSSAELPAGVGR